jgi:signal transduction histidine kinase
MQFKNDMNINPFYEEEIVAIILYTSVFFITIAIVLVLFFYYSRKKIHQKELEKKDLEIQHQKSQLHAVIMTQEQERKRIAQDLHDDISSKLNVVTLNNHLLKIPDLTTKETCEIADKIIELTAKALDSTRRIAHDLLPPVLDKLGLHAGIEELCSDLNSSKAVQVNYQNNIVFDHADKEKHLHVFRILQELMNNSVRHGRATQITVYFDQSDREIYLKYKDNGVGFDSGDYKNQNGLGMKNIESRASFLNASLKIESAIGKGIEVLLKF